jgi:hypothetical protein
VWRVGIMNFQKNLSDGSGDTVEKGALLFM